MLLLRNVGKWLLWLAICALFVLLLTVPVFAQEEQPQEDTAYTCLVHYSAYASSMVIGHMEDGAQITVLEENGDFYKVDCYDMNGYIHKDQVREENGEYFISCDPESEESSQVQYVSLADSMQVRSDVLELADDQLGTPYVMGGTRPGGFDCSGFVNYVFKNNGFSIRRTVTQQLQDMVIISRECLQPGDLIFFREGNVFSSHVGIYVGDNRIIHAGNAGIGYADLDLSYFANAYLCCRRIINVDTSSSVALSTAADPFAAGLLGLRTVQG